MYFRILFIFSIISFSFLSADTETKIRDIDIQIKTLQDELHKTRLEAMHDELTAQPHRMDDWKGYTDDIGHYESAEKKIEATKKEIERLEAEKQSLESKTPSSS